MSEITELKARIAQLEREERETRIEAENQKIIDFFNRNRGKDLCIFTKDREGNMETLHVIRVEEVRMQEVLGGRSYLCLDTTSLTIGYDYKTQGFNQEYLGKELKTNPGRFSSWNKEKSIEPIRMIWEGGIPLKSKTSYKKEFAKILDTGKIQTSVNTIELNENGRLFNFLLGKNWINPEVFDGMMQLYVKQALESAEFMQNLPEATVFESIVFK